MSDKYENMSVFQQLQAGLEDSIAHSKGQITLKTITLPAPPPKVGAAEVSRLRRKLKMSQAVFAATLNVSTKTIQSWEQGVREPSDAALRMIQVVKTQPAVVQSIFTQPSRGATSRRKPKRGPRAGRMARSRADSR
ncbi:MAG: helix-turn-helix domain-containing protein [Planctomycetes bacterium]|nr:helix-turn-helix domain-containing protein [Planctomycetota bacterium]